MGEEIVVPSAVGHKCISGPLCSHLEVNQKIGRTKNPMTRCDKCNRVCLKVELDRQLEILVRQPKDANRGFIFSGCQKEEVNGIYRANGNQRGGQPIFTNSRTALLLFYQPSRQCWVVHDTTERAQWTEFAAKVVPTRAKSGFPAAWAGGTQPIFNVSWDFWTLVDGFSTSSLIRFGQISNWDLIPDSTYTFVLDDLRNMD